jgi:hypothetical protein
VLSKEADANHFTSDAHFQLYELGFKDPLTLSIKELFEMGISLEYICDAGILFPAHYPYGEAFQDCDGTYYNRFGTQLRDPSEYGAGSDGVYTPFGDE